jgi:hypothetical protein
MSGRRRRRAGRVLITKENTIDRVPCGGKSVCFPNFHHRADLSAEAHHTAFYRKRKFGGSLTTVSSVASNVSLTHLRFSFL